VETDQFATLENGAKRTAMEEQQPSATIQDIIGDAFHVRFAKI
jgi:hypothetical protein